MLVAVLLTLWACSIALFWWMHHEAKHNFVPAEAENKIARLQAALAMKEQEHLAIVSRLKSQQNALIEKVHKIELALHQNTARA